MYSPEPVKSERQCILNFDASVFLFLSLLEDSSETSIRGELVSEAQSEPEQKL